MVCDRYHYHQSHLRLKLTGMYIKKTSTHYGKTLGSKRTFSQCICLFYCSRKAKYGVKTILTANTEASSGRRTQFANIIAYLFKRIVVQFIYFVQHLVPCFWGFLFHTSIVHSNKLCVFHNDKFSCQFRVICHAKMQKFVVSFSILVTCEVINV